MDNEFGYGATITHYLEKAYASFENCMIKFGDVAENHLRPSVIYKPRLFIDGNQWCALYGENLQEGVAGFGKSPSLAMSDFDLNWFCRTAPEAKP